jgi:hypothetical protein
MVALTYYAPDGTDTPNPSPRLLREIIFEEGPTYFETGWGGGALAVMRHGAHGIKMMTDQPMLEFFLVEPHGFFFRYYPVQGPQMVPYDGSGCDRLVKHYYGGDPVRVPVACFVSREAAWEIVKVFRRSGECSPGVNWVPFGKLEFDRGLV